MRKYRLYADKELIKSVEVREESELNDAQFDIAEAMADDFLYWEENNEDS
jgi:hypothetical protein